MRPNTWRVPVTIAFADSERALAFERDRGVEIRYTRRAK
jgi:hypothetical protein